MMSDKLLGLALKLSRNASPSLYYYLILFIVVDGRRLKSNFNPLHHIYRKDFMEKKKKVKLRDSFPDYEPKSRPLVLIAVFCLQLRCNGVEGRSESKNRKTRRLNSAEEDYIFEELKLHLAIQEEKENLKRKLHLLIFFLLSLFI